MRARIATLVLVLVSLGAACAAPARPLAPHVAGWERHFALDWTVVERGGAPVVEGHIENRSGLGATEVQILVDALDADDRVTAQRTWWLGHELAPGTRSYFEVAPPARASRYRVSVYAFRWLFDDSQ